MKLDITAVKKWRRIGHPVDNHHWFIGIDGDGNETDVIAVADDSILDRHHSGPLDPANTDDGLLLVDHSRPAVVSGDARIRVPVITWPENDETIVGGDYREAAFIVPVLSKRGYEVKIDAALKKIVSMI